VVTALIGGRGRAGLLTFVYYGFAVAANTLSNNADRRSLGSANVRELCEHDPGSRR